MENDCYVVTYFLSCLSSSLTLSSEAFKPFTCRIQIQVYFKILDAIFSKIYCELILHFKCTLNIYLLLPIRGNNHHSFPVTFCGELWVLVRSMVKFSQEKFHFILFTSAQSTHNEF